MDIQELENKLKMIFEPFKSMLIAFSGGVDSSLLLYTAFQVLGKNLLAVTATSPIHPSKEINAAKHFTNYYGIPHLIIESVEMNDLAFISNDLKRCYYCKTHLFKQLQAIAKEKQSDTIAHGANIDDLKDFRPGFKAAQELGIISPLIDANFTKTDIRTLAKHHNIPSWNKPAMSCLATRIPTGEPITLKALQMIEQSETVLLNLGITNCRVRHHGLIARLEFDDEFFPLIIMSNIRKHIINELQRIGFRYVTIDLNGYLTGNMNFKTDMNFKTGFRT